MTLLKKKTKKTNFKCDF